MAFDAGELVATIKAGGLQAFESGMAQAEGRFRSVGRAAEQQGTQAETAGRRAAAAAKQQGDAAAKAGQQTTQAANAGKAATDAATAATQKQATTARQAGTAAQEAGGKAVSAGRQTQAATDAATGSAQKQTKATRDTGTAATDAGAKAVAAGRQAEQAARAAEQQLQKQKQAASELGRTLTVAGTAALAAFAGAATSSAQLDSRLAQLRSLGEYGTSAMQQANEAALTAGTQYGLTANDVADAQIELQKANVGLTQQMGGALPGALTLAAAGQMDVAEATSIAVTAMTQFQKTGADVPHIADLLAAGADRALGSVGDLGAALKQGGLVAAQYGWSLEDSTATLSAFANAGLVGSDAGTSLKTMLLSLATPTKQQQELMDQLGISAYDASGHFVTSAELAGQLKGQLGGLDEASRNSALGILFGSDAVRAANVLYNEGQSGIEGWRKTVDAAGFASQQAAGKQDSLAGDAQKVAAAFQNDLIRAGQAVTPILRVVAQATSGVLDLMGQVPAPVLATGTALTALGGAAAVGVGAFGLFLPRMLETREALRVVKQEAAFASYGTGTLAKGLRGASTAATGFRSAAGSAASFLGGPWGIALAVGTSALMAWQAHIDAAKASTETIDAAAARGASGIDVLTAAAARGQNQAQFLNQWLTDINHLDVESTVLDNLSSKLDRLSQVRANPLAGITQGGGDIAALEHTLNTVGESLGRLAETDAPAAAKAFEQYAAKTDGSQASLTRLLANMPAYATALETQATKTGALTGRETEAQRSKVLLAEASRTAKAAGDAQADTAAQQAAAIGEIQGSAAAASTDVSQLAADIKGLGSAQLDARSAQRALQQAVDDAAKSLKGGAGALDINTQKGRDNQAAMDAIASAATGAAAATYSQTGSAKKAAEVMSDARAQFIATTSKILGSSAAAEKLADKLGLIPGNVKSLIDVQTGAAQARIDAIKAQLLNIPDGEATIYVTAKANGVDDGRARQIAVNATRANGGSLEGPGPQGVDSLIIAAAPGEHVWTHQEVQAVGGQNAMYSMRAAARSGAFAGAFATGGAVGDATSARAAAEAAQARLQERVKRSKEHEATAARAVKAAENQASRADKAVQAAQDRSSKIYGKGTGAEKHDAVLAVREAQKQADAAKAAVKAAQKTLKDTQDHTEDLRKQRDDQRKERDEQGTRQTALTRDSQDLGIANSRGAYSDPSNPFSAVDLALQYSRDDNLSPQQQQAMNALAATSNQKMLDLSNAAKAADDAIKSQTQAVSDQSDAVSKQTDVVSAATAANDKATSALQQMKDAAASMASGIASTVRGLFSLTKTVKEEASEVTAVSHNAGTAAQWDEKVTTITPGGTTVAAIRGSVESDARSMDEFATHLQNLSAMGFSTQLITDVANLGVEAGMPIIRALSVATQDDVNAINAGYRGMYSASNRAGQFVADQTYGGQIGDLQNAANATGAQLQVAQQGLATQQQSLLTAQQQLAAANANAASTNATIVSAQQAIVAQISQALSGSATTRYADGGVRDAMIAPAGANILWGEQETGGESYIPHAPAKRARSLSILQATAQRFGQVVLPMANGGYLGGSGSTDARSYGGDTYQFHGTWLGRPEDAMNAARREADARKARAVANAGLGRVNP